MSINTFKVRRMKQGCCGMEQGGVYEAFGNLDSYITPIVGGQELTKHFAPSYFEYIDDLTNADKNSIE